jgi:hypothetical protein
MPSIIFKTNRNNLDIVAKGRVLPTIREALQMAVTFGLTVFAWIFFRAKSVGDAMSFVGRMFTAELFENPFAGHPELLLSRITLGLVAVFMLIEWNGRENNYAIERVMLTRKMPVRWAFYFSLVVLIFISAGKEEQFIYFQF